MKVGTKTDLPFIHLYKKDLKAIITTSILFCSLLLPIHTIITAKNANAQEVPVNNHHKPIRSIDLNNTVYGNSANNPITSVFKSIPHSIVSIRPHLILAGLSTTPIPENASSSPGGSGWVYDQAGHIVTNAHVAVAVDNTYDVSFPDGNTYTANVIGVDPFSDLAVLNITQDFFNEHIVPLTLANSSQLEVGQQVIAIGDPYSLEYTMTVGVISNTQRMNQLNLSPGGPPASGGQIIEIQTDAAEGPGNSGGPLLNLKGELVGVNHGGVAASPYSYPPIPTGFNFAIPSNLVSKIVPWLIKYGVYPHPYLGFIGNTLTSDISLQAGLPINLKGVIVGTIIKKGPADEAGLKGAAVDQYGNITAGDVITQVDGHSISKIEELEFYIQEHKLAYVPFLQGNVTSSENVVNLKTYNNGATRDLKIVLEPETRGVVSYCPKCI